jgi:RNA polymerase sigma-70 factor (ECF subfamily)
MGTELLIVEVKLVKRAAWFNGLSACENGLEVVPERSTRKPMAQKVLGAPMLRNPNMSPNSTLPSKSRIGQVATESPLEEVMEAYVLGDAAAFGQLYRRVSPSLYAYLLRLTRDRPRAEDLLQVTFVKMHRARCSYIPGAPPVPWIFAIARRAFLDERRTGKSRFEDLSPDGKLPEYRELKEASYDELRDSLAQALESLPEKCRRAIHLTKIAGFSLTEAANLLETTRAAVKLRVHRGYTLMRDKFATFQAMSA